MAKIKLGVFLKDVLSTMALNADQYSEVLDTLDTEVEEVEGDSFYENLRALANTKQLTVKSKEIAHIVKEAKNEAYSGLVNQGLSSQISQLDVNAKAEFDKKPNATEKVRYLVETLGNKGQTSTEKEVQELRQQILDYNSKVENGEYKSKAEYAELEGKLKQLKVDTFNTKLLGGLKSKLADEFQDDDFILSKIAKTQKNKGLHFDFEENAWIKTSSGARASQATSKNDYGNDDFLNDFLAENQGFVKKSQGQAPANDFNIPLNPDIPNGMDTQVKERINTLRAKEGLPPL